jgi:hypothetical protein
VPTYRGKREAIVPIHNLQFDWQETPTMNPADNFWRYAMPLTCPVYIAGFLWLDMCTDWCVLASCNE